MERVEWLDVAVFREIERVQAVSPVVAPLLKAARLRNRLWHQREVERTDRLFLYVELPRFDFPVVFAEQVRSSALDGLHAR